MDSKVSEVYETTANVDVNKQVPYQQNMDFVQENFTADSQVADEFQLQGGDHYNVQHETDTYNPDGQQMEYQDPGLENVSNENYCPIDETSQQSYIPGQTQLNQSTTVLTNNGTTEDQIVGHQVGNETFGDSNETLTEVPVESNADIIDIAINNGITLTNQTAESSINPAESTTDSGVDNTDLVESCTDSVDSSTHPVDTNTIQTSVDQVQSITEDDNTETCLDEAEGIMVNKSKNTNDSEILKIKNAEKVEEMEQEVENNSGNEIIHIIQGNAEATQETVNLDLEETSVLETEAKSTENAELTPLKTLDQIIDSQDHYMVVETSSSGDISSQDVSESSDIQLVEVYEDTTKKQETIIVQKKQRRTRKPVHDLPMHLIGHDISKPVENVPNGRALPKPRLGVKVPYLNLTSQIVSKEELEEEIIERSRAKEQANEKCENKFARGLTQRLANKIAPEETKKYTSFKENNKKSDKKELKDVKTETKTEAVSTHGSNNSVVIDESKIENNDDLLAILEGDGEEIPVIDKLEETEADDSNLKSIEREIALQQLQELPRQLPKERIIRPRYPRSDQKAKITNSPKTAATNSSPKTAPAPKLVTSKLGSPLKSDIRSKTDIASKEDNPSPKKSISSIDLDVPSPVKKAIEIEPQVKVNMVLKTYSRKRKPSDMPEFESPSPKRPTFEDPDSNDIFEMKQDPLALPTDVYVTKSSRVIKKKVIWDPDDDQHLKAPKVATKVSDSNKVSTPKIAKPVTSDKLEKSDKKSVVTQAEKIKETKEDKSEKVSPKKVVGKNKSPPKSKRGLSEVDKLLMDEGAIKMLYELKGTEENSAKKKKDVYSVEKAEKEILKRANLLKNDLVQNTSNESPKSLRKKESLPNISPNVKQPPPILERKMSKDSTRSSVHTPPRSPTFFSSQASMLIRRRSSSSISSDDEIEIKSLRALKKTDSSKKKLKKSTTSESDSSMKGSKENATEVTPKALKGAQYKSFTLKKSGKHVSIDLHYIDDKCYFTTDVLTELTAALKRLEKEKECNVVSLTSTSQAFCLGLDYASLVSDDKKERTEKATSLAESVRDFLLCLLHFPKVIVAGIKGDCVGVGVTMLSLFDTVIASDKATFSTPYASLGCLGEATFLLTYPHSNNCGLAAELLYANQQLNADEALKRGLISKLCWPEKYKDTLNNFVTSVAQGSRQSLETTKRQLRVNSQDQIKAAINDEMEILIQHWTSAECQANFSNIEK